MWIPFGVLSSAGAGGGVPGSFDLISTTLLTGSQASVTFDVTGLGSTYKHLQIRAVARMSAAQNGATGSFRINGDTGNNYSFHYLQGTGSAIESGGGINKIYMENLYTMSAANEVTNSFAPVVIDLFNPFSSTNNKTVRALSGSGSNENRIRLGSGGWFSTTAATSVTMLSSNGGNFVSGSRFSIYGIKG